MQIVYQFQLVTVYPWLFLGLHWEVIMHSWMSSMSFCRP